MTPPMTCTMLDRRALVVAAALAPCALKAGLPELIASAKPAVVLVGTFSATDRFQFRGTGFATGDGLSIVTNAHVLPAPEDVLPGRQIVIRHWLGGDRWEQRDAEVQQLARANDLSLLRIKGPALPVLRLAGPELVAEGTEVALMGFPIGGDLGFSHATHRGIVSAVTLRVPPQRSASGLNPAAVRSLRDNPQAEIYQLDAVAYPGNSGGPLFDLKTGQVIAVLYGGAVKASREGALASPSGISYAMPVARLHELLAR
jgi:S1-C subfamily serine protease